MSTRKIVVTFGSGIVEQGLSMMREVAQVKVTRDDSEAALLAECEDAEAILVGPMPSVNRNLIESARRLRHIARVGVGIDSVDVEAATERGIIVTNAPEVTADSVAEFTVSLLLSLAKNIPRCDRAVKEGRWNERVELMGANIELRGKTHGIVGLGKIGSRVAVMCKGFGMRVLYYKRNRDSEVERSLGIEYAPFETLLRESDSISLHLPLTSETKNLFVGSRFGSMKRTALLINQARGKVVNEEALAQALREGKIGGYATDVYEMEPPDPKSELLSFKNVVVTPHLAGGTLESRRRVSTAVVEDVLKVMRGETPKNLVNREVLQRKVR
jgi:D-3-phosphoglycerate dehydrogenase